MIHGMLVKIVSGGQTGSDRAALDFAIAAGIPHGGWCPKGRLAIDGPLDPKYQLTETKSSGYSQRTRLNVQDSDGTLIFNSGALSGGTSLTVKTAQDAAKPYLVIQVDQLEQEQITRTIQSWLKAQSIRVLNVAGPREEKRPGIYSRTLAALRSSIAVTEHLGRHLTVSDLERSADTLLRERVLSKGGTQPSEEAIGIAARLLARRAVRESKQ